MEKNQEEVIVKRQCVKREQMVVVILTEEVTVLDFFIGSVFNTKKDCYAEFVDHLKENDIEVYERVKDIEEEKFEQAVKDEYWGGCASPVFFKFKEH